MTTRPPFDEHDALSPEERALAARLSSVDAGGPSAALDARIIAAARAAAAPVGAPVAGSPSGDAPAPATSSARPAAGAIARRTTRRWPTAVGAAATLVIAVGMAWQLKPLIDIPPPLRRPVEAPTSTEAEVLAHAEPASPALAPPPPVAAAADASASPVAPERAAVARAARAARSDAPALKAATAPIEPAPIAQAARHDDYLDEAVGDPADTGAVTAAATAAPEAASPRALALQEADAEASAAAQLDRVEVTGSRLGASPAAPRAVGAPALPPVASDPRLAPLEWLERVRARRDAGQVEDARASLRRFVRAYPRHRLPDDLRALLVAPR